jgi:hypothetical protein
MGPMDEVGRGGGGMSEGGTLSVSHHNTMHRGRRALVALIAHILLVRAASVLRTQHRRRDLSQAVPEVHFPEDAWKIAHVPDHFKVSFNVVHSRERHLVQYTTTTTLDVTPSLRLEYALGSAADGRRCLAPSFSNLSTKDKAELESQRGNSKDLLPSVKSFLKDSSNSLLEMGAATCMDKITFCDVCMKSTARSLKSGAVVGTCNEVDESQEKVCRKIIGEMSIQFKTIQSSANEVYDKFGPSGPASMFICTALECCQGSAMAFSQPLHRLESCECEHRKKEPNKTHKPFNASRKVWGGDYTNFDPKEIEKEIQRASKQHKALENKRRRAEHPEYGTGIYRGQLIKRYDDATAKILRMAPLARRKSNRTNISPLKWSREWEIVLEVSMDKGKHWTKLKIPEGRSVTEPTVHRVVTLPDLVVEAGHPVKYRLTQNTSACACCSDLFVRSFSPL